MGCALFHAGHTLFRRGNHYRRFGEMFQVAGDNLRAIFGKGRAVETQAFSRRDAAIEFLLAGATAVAVGTATFADPGVAAAVHDGIADYCERQGFPSASSLVGALA